MAASTFQPGEISLFKSWWPEADVLQAHLREVVASGALTRGSFLEAFEAMDRDHLGVEHVLGVASGMSGLLLALSALPQGSQVILPSFSFEAAGQAVVRNRLQPVFVDCEPDTFTLSPQAVERAITPEISAILAIHVFGSPADHEKLRALADDNGLSLIYYADHGLGASYQGVPVGSLGDVSIVSCAAGQMVMASEGALVATRSEDLARHLATGREHGDPSPHDCPACGSSARMSECSAIMAIHTLRLLPAAVAQRTSVAERYRENLQGLPGISFQTVRPGCQSSWPDFALVIAEDEFGMPRGQLAAYLDYHNLPTHTYGNPPLHGQRAYSRYADLHVQPLEVTERLARCVLCLPIYPGLSKKTVDDICQVIHSRPTRRATQFAKRTEPIHQESVTDENG